MTNPLEYVSTPIPEDGVLKFSPSQFAKFISAIHAWYRDEIAGDNPFSHSTSTVIGTIVHYCAEMVAKGKEVSTKHINEYIDSLEVNDDYIPSIVRAQYPEMAERLVNDYVMENSFLEVEVPHYAEVSKKYYAAGTLDALQGTKEDCMIVDYKTYHSKTKPRAIPSGYKYQLLVYAFILRKNGYGVNRIRLVYINRHIEGEVSLTTGKKLKSYPPEVTELTESITEDDMAFIESQLQLAVATVEFGKEHPHMLNVIYHDPRLKSDGGPKFGKKP